MKRAQAILITVIGVATLFYSLYALITNEYNLNWLLWASVGVVEVIIGSHFEDAVKKGKA